MNKNTTIVVIVIIVVVIIGFLVFSNSNQSATPSYDQSQTAATSTDTTGTLPVVASSSPQTYAVTYTDQGFSPSSITVKNGDSVTWTNNSTGKLWVASDPHPTHTDLPGFDEKAVIMAGSSWTYTFVVSGTHGYHNHTNHTMTGTVIVQ